MNIELSPAVTSWIEQNLAAGKYRSHDDAIRRLLETGIEREEKHQQALMEVEEKIQAGIDALANGDFVTEEELLAEIEKLERSWS
jgi:putative addiction module CopG family antidote